MRHVMMVVMVMDRMMRRVMGHMMSLITRSHRKAAHPYKYCNSH
jgi:hypothetical protein